MSINDKVSEIIDTLFGGNKRAFAKCVKISPTVVENVVGTRRGKPSYDVIYKICSNANISPAWLITGKGDMITSDSTPRNANERSTTQTDDARTQNSDITAILLDRIEQQACEIARLRERVEQLTMRNP